jgi:hypothetical protein
MLTKYFRIGGANGGMGHGVGLLGRSSMRVTFGACGRAGVTLS